MFSYYGSVFATREDRGLSLLITDVRWWREKGSSLEVRLRIYIGFVGFALLCATGLTSGCRSILNIEGDGLMPVQSFTATVLGYERDVECENVAYVSVDGYNCHEWQCGMDRPIRLEPYRKSFVSKRLKVVAEYASLKLELGLAFLLCLVGFWGQDRVPNRYPY